MKSEPSRMQLRFKLQFLDQALVAFHRHHRRSMSSRKRARDESDDEEPSFGRQILPVANLPADFSGMPMDGMEYLFTVRCVHASLFPFYSNAYLQERC